MQLILQPLDPYPLPALVIIILLVNLPIGIAFYVALREFGMPLLKGKVNVDTSKNEEEQVKYKERRRNRNRKLSIFLILWNLLFFVVSYVSMHVVSQAILIRRVFNANINICA